MQTNQITRRSCRLTPLICLAMAALASPTFVLAHEGSSLPYGSFLGGLMHPVLGLDHFLAMISVGIVSAQIGGRAIWTVPATFVCVMSVGGLLGLLDIGLSATEMGIALSVLGLGTAIAIDKRLPISLALSVVGFFAIFHGYAHGLEMPKVANAPTYAAGFLTGTAVLHIAGVLLGDIAQHYKAGKWLLRVAGAAIAATGLAFLAGSA